MYIITKSLNQRNNLIKYLKKNMISAVFHYVPLHDSRMGEKFCKTRGDLSKTVKISQRILRLPIFYEMTESEVGHVVEIVRDFYLRNQQNN